MAREVVTLYHGAKAGAAAEEAFDAVFKRRELPQDVAEFPLPDGDPVHLPAAMVAAGLAVTTSAARRDVDAGSVRIDGVVVAATHYNVARAELADRVVTVGKRRSARLRDQQN